MFPPTWMATLSDLLLALGFWQLSAAALLLGAACALRARRR